jgi:hypothetical protein
MKTEKPTWQILNAYVDGELGPKEAADVARAAGVQADVTEQISLLYKVKGGVEAAFPSAPEDLASLIPPPRRRLRRPAIAAAIVVAAAGTLAMLCLLPLGTALSPTSNEFIATARIMHDRWLTDEKANTVDRPPVVLAALRQFGRLPLIPDLESSGLSIGLVSVSGEPGRRVLQIGYRGHHGCHLSLFVFAGGQHMVAATLTNNPLERFHAWHVGDLDYSLFAKGMDKSRFELIGEKVENATRVNRPLDRNDRTELAENKRNTTRCQT